MARLPGVWELETAYGDVWELTSPGGGILRLTGHDLPPATVAGQRTPTQHGSARVAFVLEDREVIVGVTMRPAYTVRGVDCHRLRRTRATHLAFNQLAQPMTLRCYKRDRTKWELRRCDYGGGAEGDSEAQWEDLEIVAFRLVCRDPAWYQDSSTLSYVYGDFSHGLYTSTLSITTGLTAGGDWYNYPVIVITGPCTDFDLYSVTSGQRLRYTGDVAAGETVTLTCDPLAPTALDDAGDNVEQYIPPSDELGGFALWPHPVATDGANEWSLEVEGITAASGFSFTWEHRWQGGP